MVVFGIFAKMRSVGGVFAAAAALFGSHPALANSSNAADIAAPLRVAQDSSPSALGHGDAEFRQMFSSWSSLDKSSGYVAPAAAPVMVSVGSLAPKSLFRTGSVSIPSRMPVEGVRLTSDYGSRFHPVLGGRRQHNGVDLAGAIGTPVHATADAVVSKAEWFSSYGLFVQLEHGGAIETRYGHMSRLNVYAGQQVRKGDVIGYIGSTGRSTGPHLHYEVRISGQPVNPGPYMQAEAFGGALAVNRAPSGLIAAAR